MESKFNFKIYDKVIHFHIYILKKSINIIMNKTDCFIVPIMDKLIQHFNHLPHLSIFINVNLH